MPNKYEQIADSMASEDRAQRGAAAMMAATTTPAKASEVIRLSSRTGIPRDAVATDPDAVRVAARRAELDTLSPELASWATTTPERYAKVADNTGWLGRMGGLLQKQLDTDRAFLAAVPNTIGSTFSGIGELYNVGVRAIDRAVDAVGIPNPRVNVPIWLRPGDSFVQTGARVKDVGAAIDVPEERRNLATDIASGTGQLAGQVVQGMVAPQTLAPSLLAQGADQMAERVRASGTQGTGGGDAAIVGGAAVTAAMERIGIDKVVSRLPPAVRNRILRNVTDVALAGGIEAAQETAEGLAQDVLTQTLLDPDWRIGEDMARQAEAAGGTGAIVRALVRGVGGRRARMQARAERQHLGELVEAAQDSPLADVPEELADLAESQRPGASIYVTPEALEQHYGERTESALTLLTGDPDAYAEAKATGADVQIPLSRYLSTITPDAHRALADHARLQPSDVKPGDPDPDLTAEVESAVQTVREGRVFAEPDDTPLLTREEIGAESWAEYEAMQREARDARRNAAQLERDRQAERAKERQRTAEFRTLRAEVEAELAGHPIYAMQRTLRAGKLADGSPAVKLDHAAVVEAYGQDVADKLKGLTRKKGGASPDQVAALFGYTSGGQMIHDLTTAPTLRDMAHVEADARMQARMEAVAEPDQVDDIADAQTRLLLREIQAVEARAGGIRTHDSALRETAKRIIEAKQVTRLEPHLYEQAARKAEREAYGHASAGRYQDAIAARRKQLLSTYLHREARNARDESTRAGRYLAQFSRKKTRQALGKAGSDYLEQIDAILARFSFANLTRPQMAERSRLAAWLAEKAKQGVLIDIPPTVADEAYRVPFKRLRVGELREVRDAVRSIAHAANNVNLVRLEGETFEREAIDLALAGSVEGAHKARIRGPGEPSRVESLRSEALAARGVLSAATDLARQLDGYKDLGAVWTHTVGVIRKANDRVNAEIKAAGEGFAALRLRHYTKAELRANNRRVWIPEIGAEFTKNRILALALNWGNEGNRQAVLTQVDGRLTPAQVGALFARLDSRDWDFIEATWAQLDRHWPAIAQAQRRRTGLAPAKVPAAPFAVEVDGKVRIVAGGYYPLKYEARNVKELREADAELYESIRTGRFAKAATARGHTIERIGSGGRTVRLDLGVVMQHERQVIRDLHLGDAVNYVHNALHGAKFGEAVNRAGLGELVTGLDTWLRDTATGEVGVTRGWERGIRLVRTNFTAAVLGYKLTSALLQTTGLLQSGVTLRSKGAVVRGVLSFWHHPIRETRRVTEASAFMRERLQTHVEAVQQVMDADAGRFKDAHGAMIRGAYWMIGRVQATVDVVTWLAAEEVAHAKFNGDPEKIRAFADDLVSRAQGSGDFVNKTALQRGTLGANVRQSEVVRLSTALQSYLYAKMNVAVERTAVTSFRDPMQVASWAGDMVSLFVAEGIIAAIIRGAWPGDEDDDGSVMDDWLAAAGEEGLSALLGGLPFIGAGVSEIRGYDAGSVVEDAWEAVAKALKQTEQGEADAALRRSYVNLAGFLMGVPSSQANKTLDALEAANDGKEVSPYEILIGPKKE